VGSIAVINSMGEMTEKFYIPIGPEITGLFINEVAMVNTCNSIYVSEGNRVHKVSLKNESESKMGDSILKQH
jgi:hypothetical protein